MTKVTNSDLYRKLQRVEALIRAARQGEIDALADEDDEDNDEEDCPCDSGDCDCGPCKKKRLAASASRRYRG